ncbi:hypothetical protein [Pantoea sp. ME81]|uniref:hypothetical protein n=1 Tax=Pantoea sp. ME81 TaxID=2743935 RepID=UPI0015F49233|nr:hypothetical protein [Pantoea sp. ME81]
MNTENSQTASTAGTWFNNLRIELLRVRRTQHLRLAELENVLIEIVTSDYVDDGLILQWAGQVAEAGLLTHQMIDSGFINTPAMFELALSVQELAVFTPGRVISRPGGGLPGQ